MSFYDCCKEYKDFDFDLFFNSITESDILNILEKQKIDSLDFLALLSPKAEKFLEQMAQKAHQLTLQHFGKSILLFTPMYLANYCVNRCAYCSYNAHNMITRKKLTPEEIEKEAASIAKTGLKHILILTGESAQKTPVSYMVEAVGVLRKYFQSIGIEVYPLKEEDYRELIQAGVDCMTIFQETYDEQIYDNVHLSGPKKNYRFRLDTPERACKAGMRGVNIGALLGLNDWRKEAFMTGLHADYLQNRYPEVQISISLPRIRPHVGVFEKVYPVHDKDLVQILLAQRLFLHRVGMTISTRERQYFRDHLIYLGITKMSAGVTTEVGGHTASKKGHSQFEISDPRTVSQMKAAILKRGYQPILKDWFGADWRCLKDECL